jgi:UDP-N-acetyl-D-mannosaminuronic acid transferase (WecB/TagA/CpsF family)
MPVRLFGMDFADLDPAAAAAWVAARPEGAPFGYVVTPNADHLVRLARDPALRAIYQDAALRLLDSRVVARLAGLFGLRAPRVAPGSDLVALLLAHHLRQGERITIIGMRPRWLAPLCAMRGLAPPFHHDPPMHLDRGSPAFADAVRFVLDHPARLVFLAIGSPLQERLAAAVQATGQATGTGLCIGAGLEFLAGAQSRAPLWMQRASLEWLYRLAREPRRLWRRYLVHSPGVVGLLMRERWGWP